MYWLKSKAGRKIVPNKAKNSLSYPKNAFGVGANYRDYLIIELHKIQ
jgi:hypothetical protein